MDAEEIIALTNRIIRSLDSQDFPHDAVNWTRLRCTAAKQFKDDSWWIVISGAAPNVVALRDRLTAALQAKQVNVYELSIEW
jgi:hypothetical protein